MSAGDLLDPAVQARLERARGEDAALNHAVLIDAARAVCSAFRPPLDHGQLRGPSGTALRLLEAALIPFSSGALVSPEAAAGPPQLGSAAVLPARPAADLTMAGRHFGFASGGATFLETRQSTNLAGGWS